MSPRQAFQLMYSFYNQIKFRKVQVPHVSALIDTEDSSVHWQHLDVAGKIILDLGCGLWGVNDIRETSPVYFKNKGAKKIIGVDSNADDVLVFKKYFNENFKGDESEFIVKEIACSNDLLELITKYNVESIKCDIEGFEKVMFNITKDQVKNIESISVEYHSHTLLLRLIKTLKNWNFEIINYSLFTYAPQSLGVLTAIRKVA